jgi:acyl-coenzyme A thioesterase PaaI-like protein
MSTMLRETLFVRTFGLVKIPLIFFLGPSVLELSEQRTVVRVPLTFRTKNHLGSMYFGALCIGADLAGGLLAMKLGRERSKKFSLAFKDVEGKFTKRADGDVHFVCEQGTEIRALIDKAISTGERQNMPVRVNALVPSKYGTEPVAQFTLTLSIRA